MSRRTSTFVLVSSILAGCLAGPSDGPAPALTGGEDPVLQEDGGAPPRPVLSSGEDAGRDAAPVSVPDASTASATTDAAPEIASDGGGAPDDSAAPAPGDAAPEDDAGPVAPPEEDAGHAEPPPACAVVVTLTSRCVGCHGSGARNGVELDELAKLGAESAKYPGQRIAERVLARMRDADRPMPPRGDRVPEAEAAAVEAWIAAGRPDESSCP